jgi:hypothetical protein
VDGQHVMTLMDHWKCEANSCPNKSSYCFIAETIHLKLMAANLKSWSMAINEDLADIDTAPETLAKTFMPAKGSVKNPFRDPVKISSSKDANISLGPSPFQQLLPQQFPSYIPPNFGYYPFAPPSQYPHLPPVLSSPSPQRVGISTIQQNDIDPPSSPPQSHDDTYDKLTAYINYLIRKNPSLKDSLTTCLEKLQGEQIVFSTIDLVTDEDFDLWEIKKGIRLLLKSQKKIYLKAKQQGRAE